MASSAPSPRYADLPARPGAPPGSSWGVWSERPDGDLLGCLNRLTPERVRAAAACIRTGRVFPLDLPVGAIDPPLFGRAAPRHEVLGPVGGSGHDDLLHDLNTQSGTQWDGFRHVAHPEHGFYGGVADEDHGIDVWARHGIAGRGVLADVARWRERAGRPLRPDAPDAIAPDELLACLEDQGTEVAEGDILLVRTGWVGWYRGLDAERRAAVAASLACPGLAPGEATAAALWDLGLAAVAADNPALEVWPLASRDRTPEVFVHTSLLPLLGLPIGELWDLDALAEDCAADGTYDCFLTSAPLAVRGGVGSPPGAIAIR